MATSTSSKPSGTTVRTGTSGASSRSRAREKQRSKEQRRATEAELLGKDTVTPDDVLALERATDTHLCPVEANVYGLVFTKFRVRHIASDTVLFEVGGRAGEEQAEPLSPEMAESSRDVDYVLPVDVLKLKRLGAMVEFRVGQRPIENFRMIEVHYFGDRRLKIFDFKFGFCIPGSVNTCEHMYELPDLDDETTADMVAKPKATKSDSFYFAEDKLFMHNRCSYTYVEPDN